jgi:hypothetical protein
MTGTFNVHMGDIRSEISIWKNVTYEQMKNNKKLKFK